MKLIFILIIHHFYCGSLCNNIKRHQILIIIKINHLIILIIKQMDQRFDEAKYFQPYRAYLQKDPQLRWKKLSEPYYLHDIDQYIYRNNNYLNRGSPIRKLERSTSHLLKSQKNNSRFSPKHGMMGNTRKRVIWDELYEKGIQQRKKILEKHKEKEDKLDEQCTFKPILRGKSQRYIVNNQFDFLQRNNIWVQNKIVKMVKEKEELTHQDLRQCTFSPKINKSRKNLIKQKSTNKKKNHNNLNKSTLLMQKDYNNNTFEAKKEKIPYDVAKNKIRKELQNILF